MRFIVDTKAKIYPTKVPLQAINQLETTDAQESLLNRHNVFRSSPLNSFRYKVKKSILLLIIICACLLIIYANTNPVVRSRIFPMFQSKISTANAEFEADTFRGGSSSWVQQQKAAGSKDEAHQHFVMNASHTNIVVNSKLSNYNIFVIYTKDNYHLHMKFDLFARSLLKHTNLHLHIHIITDKNSEYSVVDLLQKHVKRFRRTIFYTLYDIKECSKSIRDITSVLSPYFNSSPNSYYSEPIFFLSLGLHRIAEPSVCKTAILLDCDIVFRSDIRLLFAEFDRFSPTHLFGLAPELTPVYRHILYRYRVTHPKTNFGNPYYPTVYNKSAIVVNHSNNGHGHGYPGLNSGVVLLHLDRIRSSKYYSEMLNNSEINKLSTKYYFFRGHLADQDFYTLLGFEYPDMIYRLDCVWNRQLCTWWKEHGYSDIFDAYFRCDGVIRMYHGNCNTRIPE